MRGLIQLVCLSLLAFAAGCQRPLVPSAPAGPKSPTGWEVRYNAALALARRGSPRVTDAHVWDTLLEMLDEDQQLRNFRTARPGGREATDETAARLTVIGALKAVQELHRRQPGIDLSSLKEPIEKLAHSPNVPVSTEAKQAQLALSQQS